MIQHGWLLVLGCLMFGYLLPEFFVVLGKGTVSVPMTMNLFSAVAAALIAASFVY